MAEEKRGGTLIIIGGHEDREGEKKILQEVARRAGSGKLVVSTVGTSEPDEMWETYRQAFTDLGVSRIEHLDVSTREEALDPQCEKILEGATVVFFTGGDQLKITSQLGDSRSYQRIEEIYHKGGTIAGTSAGASVMSETMLVAGGGEESHKVESMLRMAPGLGFIQDVVVDQHFAERGRIGRLLAAVAQNPRQLGVGIDEDTAIVVEDNLYFDVIGSGAVYVLDGSQVSYSNLGEAEQDRDKVMAAFDFKLHLMAEGDRFDLQKRRPEIPSAPEISEKVKEKKSA